MSQPAVSWVIEHSPYEGALFLVHIVVADTVDDREELRVSQRWLSRRAKVHRRTTEAFVRRALEDGYLEETGPGPRRSMNYRLVRNGGPDGPEPLAQSVHHSNGATGAVSAPTTGAPLVHDWRSTGTPGGTRSGAVLAQSDSHSSSSSSSTSVSRAHARARGAPDDATGPQPQNHSSGKSKGENPEGVLGDGIKFDELRWEVGPSRRPPGVRLNGDTRPVPARDRLVDAVYFAAADAGYDDAVAVVARLRQAGVPDDVIDRTATKAAAVGAPTLAYLEVVARTHAGLPDPVAVKPAANADDAALDEGGAA